MQRLGFEIAGRYRTRRQLRSQGVGRRGRRAKVELGQRAESLDPRKVFRPGEAIVREVEASERLEPADGARQRGEFVAVAVELV